MRKVTSSRAQICDFMATPNGLEPSTSSVTGWRANRLHHRAKSFGGNNRARTCDLLLVRQMLSQLSYAPVSRGVHLSDMAHYRRRGAFCQALFSTFFKKTFCPAKRPLYRLNQMFFSSSWIFSGVKVWTVSQNWQVMCRGSPSAAISESSFRPREIRAASIRSREQ